MTDATVKDEHQANFTVWYYVVDFVQSAFDRASSLTFASDSTITHYGLKYVLYHWEVDWDTAKRNCESLGQQLVILNTVIKTTGVVSQV